MTLIRVVAVKRSDLIRVIRVVIGTKIRNYRFFTWPWCVNCPIQDGASTSYERRYYNEE